MKRVLILGAAVFFAACPDCGGGTQGVFPEFLAPGSPTDFGTVPVLNNVELDLELRSVGRATLEFSSITLEHDDGVFEIVSEWPSEMEGGGTEFLKVRFTPLAEQTYTNTIIFVTNELNADGEEGLEHRVTLTGTGSTRAIIAVEPGDLLFGRIPECGTSVLLLTIKSLGTADLVINSIAFTEDSHPAFGFVGSTTTPAVIPTTDSNGLPGEIQVTVRASAPSRTEGDITGTIRLETTDPERREVLIPVTATINRAPTAVIGPVANASPGQTVTFDGAASSDPDGDDPLTYLWTLRSKPLTSDTELLSTTEVTTSMTLDATVPGQYEVQLDVFDAAGARSCQPARAVLIASPAQKLLVEMFWDNAGTDVDLHVTRDPNAAVFSFPDDCYYQNPRPDWGIEGTTDDDPEFMRDALTGYGPETFGYVNPVDGTYRVWAVLNNALLANPPDSTVTVRVSLFGVLKAETSKTLTITGETWPALDVTWPSGEITVVPQ